MKVMIELDEPRALNVYDTINYAKVVEGDLEYIHPEHITKILDNLAASLSVYHREWADHDRRVGLRALAILRGFIEGTDYHER